ncbi:hypothetical protein PC123_g21386 [Phytophthora cactorum]|nr:hypothetical protein PC123_g21386 [Phytophthora cactorum]
MSDFLNDAKADGKRPVPVGETCDIFATARKVGTTSNASSRTEGRPLTDDGKPLELLLVSSIGVFGLRQKRFVEEKKRTPWIPALIAFLENGALGLDPQLRTKTILMARNNDVKYGVLV